MLPNIRPAMSTSAKLQNTTQHMPSARRVLNLSFPWLNLYIILFTVKITADYTLSHKSHSQAFCHFHLLNSSFSRTAAIACAALNLCTIPASPPGLLVYPAAKAYVTLRVNLICSHFNFLNLIFFSFCALLQCHQHQFSSWVELHRWEREEAGDEKQRAQQRIFIMKRNKRRQRRMA